MKYPVFKQSIIGAAGITLLLISQALALPDANSDVLSQKILLENTIQQRVSDAVYRILRNENFIVNVDVIMEATPTKKYTTIYETPDTRESVNTLLDHKIQSGKQVSSSATPITAAPGVKQTRTVLKKRPIKTNVASDIPGFPGIQAPGFELYEEEVPIEDDNSNDVVYAAAEDLPTIAATQDSTTNKAAAEASLSLDENEVILEEDLKPVAQKAATDQNLVDYAEPEIAHLARHTVASTTSPSLRVEKMQLTVILEDPTSPQVVENIRTVAMVASHFNRQRGDKLQVMTADFQGTKTNKPDTEQILLKSIAEKMTAIEARQKQETENKKIKDLEAAQERMKLEQANQAAQDAELARLRDQELQKQKAHEVELAKIRQQEAERVQQREDELKALRQQEEQRLADERRQMFEAQQQQAQERLRQDSLRLVLLTEQLSDLKNQLSSVDLEQEQRLKLELEQKRREADKSAIREREDKLKQEINDLNNRRLQASMVPENNQDQTWIYILGAAVLLALVIIVAAMLGGRRRTADLLPPPQQQDAETPVEEPVTTTPEPLEEELPEPEVDHELVEEVDSIKKSVVSLAVSKPGSASSIVKDWLQDTGEPEATEGESEETTNGNKTKKGRK